MLKMSNVEFIKSNENPYFENYKKFEIFYQLFIKDKINPREKEKEKEKRKNNEI